MRNAWKCRVRKDRRLRKGEHPMADNDWDDDSAQEQGNAGEDTGDSGGAGYNNDK